MWTTPGPVVKVTRGYYAGNFGVLQARSDTLVLVRLTDGSGDIALSPDAVTVVA